MTLPIRRMLPIPTSASKNARIARGGAEARQSMDERERWHSYFVPGTSVMRNKLGRSNQPDGTMDRAALAELEEKLTLLNVASLVKKPLPGSFDLEHMQRIHARVLGDVYDWAGTLRDVNLTKLDHDPYTEHGSIEAIWAEQHEKLREQDFLKGITEPEEFADKLASHWGMVNHAHAFREGNSRTQAVFFKQLAAEAGWDLDVSRLNPKHAESVYPQFVDARFHHLDNDFDHEPLARVLSQVLTHRESEPERGLRPTVKSLADRFRRFPELAPEPLEQHRDNEPGGPQL